MIQPHLQPFLLHLRLERGLSENAISSYASDLRQFFVFLGGRQCNESSISAFSQDLFKRELALRSVSRKLSALRLFLRYLRDNGVIQFPIDGLCVKPKPGVKIPKNLRPEQTAQLLRTDNEFSKRDRAILELFYSSGLRVSEMSMVALSDLSSDGLLRIKGKGERERIVPVGDTAMAAVSDYVRTERLQLRKSHSGDLLFLGKGGRRLSRQTLYKIVREAGKRVCSKHVTPHMLRHSFATDLLNGKADIREVQELLGHASVTTTQIYTHLTREKLKEQYRQFHPKG